MCGIERLPLEAQTIHAGIEFEPDLEHRAGGRCHAELDLLGRMHHEFEACGGGGAS